MSQLLKRRFFEQIILPGEAGGLWFAGDVASQGFLGDPDTPNRIISFAVTEDSKEYMGKLTDQTRTTLSLGNSLCG